MMKIAKIMIVVQNYHHFYQIIKQQNEKNGKYAYKTKKFEPVLKLHTKDPLNISKETKVATIKQ